jgi:hypothetical protein
VYTDKDGNPSLTGDTSEPTAYFKDVVLDTEPVVNEEPGPVEKHEFEEFAEFLRELYFEMQEILRNPKELAPIATEVLVVAPAAGAAFDVGKYVVKKMKDWALDRDNQYSSYIVQRMEKLVNYFARVPRARRGDIAKALGMKE